MTIMGDNSTRSVEAGTSGQPYCDVYVESGLLCIRPRMTGGEPLKFTWNGARQLVTHIDKVAEMNLMQLASNNPAMIRRPLRARYYP